MEITNQKIVVLIDAENISHKYTNTLFNEVAKYGTAYLKRIYGDWSSAALKNWKNEALKFSINPVQQFSYTIGKSSSDSAMIIDAMDILYTDNVDCFCIVSSDSDFTRLASRLREAGKSVIGFGEKKTPQPFITACDKFIYLDLISNVDVPKASTSGTGKRSSSGKTQKESLSPITVPHEIINLLRKIINENTDDEEGWILLSKVGILVNRYKSDFDYRVYGATSLSALFKMLNDQFETQMRETSSPEDKHPYVRCK